MAHQKTFTKCEGFFMLFWSESRDLPTALIYEYPDALIFLKFLTNQGVSRMYNFEGDITVKWCLPFLFQW